MKRNGIGVGSASLIIIFSTLCLAAFSLLTLATANREKNFTTKLGQSVLSYYAADAQAVEVAAKLQTAAFHLTELPSEINNVTIFADGKGIYTYSCPIDGRRSISVMLRNTNGELTIITWNETDTEDWVPDEQLNVWKGD